MLFTKFALTQLITLINNLMVVIHVGIMIYK